MKDKKSDFDPDLDLENKSLELDLKLRYDAQFHKGDTEVDPAIHNEFLKNVMAFEEMAEGPKRPMKSLFPEDFTFPAVESMTKRHLKEKLAQIEEILGRNGIEIGFRKEIPKELVYRHLVEDVIPHDEVLADPDRGFTWVLDGCDGACDVCFQLKYCDTGKEIMEEEKRKGGS